MPGESSRNLQAFESGLHALGYVEGQTIIVERRYGDPKGERLHELATELIKLKADVIVSRHCPPQARRIYPAGFRHSVVAHFGWLFRNAAAALF